MSIEKSHGLAACTPIMRTEPAVAPARGSGARVALDWIDRQALVGLVDGDPTPLVDWTTASANALSGEDKAGARFRLLGRAIAGERARMSVLESLLDERLAARDADGAAMIDRVLVNTTKRLVALLGEHRAACSAGSRPTVVVGHADEVHIDAGE